MRRSASYLAHHSTQRVWLIPMALLLIASLACSLSIPDLSRSEATPTMPAEPSQAQESTANAPVETIQATTPVNLPPALVEVNPQPGSTAAGAAPVFYFNQPMERSSVEGAFQVQPPQNGQFEWLDDSAVRYIPDGEAVEGLDVTITTGAQAANGLALSEPIQVHFQAAGLLNLAERLPAPDAQEVNPSSAVAATFNRPIIPLGAGADESPAAFTLDPPAEGRGEWLNTSTYIFYPEPALAGGARYTVHVNSALVSTDGAALAPGSPLDWSFSTAAPVLLTVSPSTEQPVPLDSAFTLTFNQTMDRASVEAAFSLLGPDDSPLPGAFSWNEASTEMTFTPAALLQRSTNYSLALNGSAHSQGGAAIGQDFVAVIISVQEFAIIQTRPAAGEALSTYSGYGTVSLSFSSPVAAGQDFTDLISIEPAVLDYSANRDFEGGQVYISGYFAPSTSYTLSVDPALRDKWDALLGVPFSFTFSTEAAEPNLIIAARLMGAQALFVPANETALSAQATNLTQLNVKRGSLSLADFLRAAQEYDALTNWASKVEFEWTAPLSMTPNVSEQIEIPLSPDRSALTPGLYFLKADTTPAIGGATGTLPVPFVVSPIQMTMKVSSSQAFVWAVRIDGNAPLPGAEVRFLDSSGAALGSCLTDVDGKCQTAIPAREDDYKPIFAVIGQPGQDTFSLMASDWYQGVAAWDFRMTYASQGNRPEVYLYTDRPIYRPGQAVNLRAVVRSQDNGRYGPAPLDSVTIDVHTPYDMVTGQNQVLASLPMQLDAVGSAAATYVLPEDATPGSYTLSMQEVEFENLSFEVAEYRKPEIDLQVSFAEMDVLTGADLQASVQAKYFFGAPAGNMPVHWTLFRSSTWLNLPDALSVGRVNLDWENPWFFTGADLFITEGQGQTGPDGVLSLTIPAADLRDRLGEETGMPLDLALEVTVEDESGLAVSARASTRLHPSPYYIGVRPESWTGQAGKELTYYIRSVDWAGNAVPDKPLSARFSKVSWTQRQSSDPSSPPQMDPEFTEIGSTDFRTSAVGDARLAFLPRDPGTYMLEITGENGAITQQLTWVGGSGAAPWPTLPNQRLQLRTDRGTENQPGEYKPGETARIFIPNPFVDGALALVTVERGAVMQSSVTTVQGASYELELPLAEEHAPNIFVSVILLGRNSGRPDFRMGYVELLVDPSAQLLQVDVQTSPEEPQPGGDLTVTLRVKDAQDQPVEGVFSLALVDKAVLALADPNTQPIDEEFYGRQPLGVQSSVSLAAYTGRTVYAPLGRGGGGGGSVQIVQPVRSKFEDTAYWNGSIQTDATGVAQVTIGLPDNLTTWRADVRGLSSDARVGSAELDLTVSKPFLLTPVTPRFAVAGDHMVLAAVVHNNTESAQRASVRLEAAGFALDNPDLAALPVDLPPGERRRVEWLGTVLSVDSLDLTFSAETVPPDGESPLRDAATPENNPLPVLRYTSSQVFGTSGVLSEAGELQELVSLPRSFTPTGAQLRLELAPSLTAAILDGLKVVEEYPYDFTEPVLSRLLPNLATRQALKAFQLEDETRFNTLESAITSSVERLMRLQNADGGWGWAAGYASDPYISSYALLGISRAGESGVFVDPEILRRGQEYLLSTLVQPTQNLDAWQLDRLAFADHVLIESGRGDLDLTALYDFRAKLSPWGQAFLALAIEKQTPGDERARTIITDLQSSASRSATGASWQDASESWRNWSTRNFTTAVVVYAIARIDPASQVLLDAVRYLMLSRQPNGAWASSYETSWSLIALVETMRGTGDLQADYTYSALLNDSPLIDGRVETPAQAVNPVLSNVQFAGLLPSSPNLLSIQRGEGAGRLYYRAYLQVDRPAEDAPAVDRGLSISRQYTLAGQDCRTSVCAPLDAFDTANPQPVQARLTLTVPENMYYVVVEDYFPAGAEVLNPRLKTTQQNVAPIEGEPLPEVLPYNPENPFAGGWGWWRFKDPRVYDDHIRWVVDFLPAGSYELTYRLTPYLAGEFRVLPAHAWQYYFPEVEGASSGAIVTIQ